MSVLLGPFGALICFIASAHKDRRLRNSEAGLLLLKNDTGLEFPTMAQTRICDRCSRLRAIKARKPKTGGST